MKEKQSRKGTIITLSILGAMTIAIYVLAYYIYGETSVFNKSISANSFVDALYQKIPSLLRSIQIVTIFWLINIIISACLSKMLSKSKRGATIVKLLNSFIKYLLAIIAIMLILNAWGVDTATLLAGAGILSLVIGLGAQSLIADIIAGMFIVFEGEFQVGSRTQAGTGRRSLRADSSGIG